MDARRRILIIDDEQDNLDYLQAELERKLDVSLAIGGSEGIARFGEKNFDLVLTDVRMAGIDGIQVLKTIKQMSPGCEVLLMSGFSDLDAVISAMNEGAFAFVTKPIMKAILLSRIDHAIAVVQAHENQTEVMRELKQNLLVQSRFAQKLSALAAMSGGVAHELQQPLSGISMFSATVKKMVEQGREIEAEFLIEIMGKIEKQVDRARDVIDHMREFSSGKESLATKRLNLSEAVTRALDLFRLQLHTHRIALQIDIPAELEIDADQNRLEQVVVNLVSNAKDSIILSAADRAEPADQDKIHILGQKENGRVVMDVIDTGCGVPDSMADRLFDPFVTTKTEMGGSGLGLFICRSVLDDFAASIELLHTGKQGSTFRVQFQE